MAVAGGWPCLLRSRAAFDRLFALANESPWIGMEFCCGTWMEGLRLEPTPAATVTATVGGRDPTTGLTDPSAIAVTASDERYLGEFGTGAAALLEALHDFVTRGKVGIVHLRNCTAPLPCFAETFIDDGFFDVLSIAETLTAAGYTGTVVLDHTPPFAGENGDAAATAFSIGYIKATLRAAQAAALRR